MQQTLFNTLKDGLQLSDKKIRFFINFIESIIEKKTINLDTIAGSINPNNKKLSNYRSIQRFFKEFNVCFTYLAKILMNNLSEDKKILIIDRTQWKGINIFFLSIEYKNVAIPILWNILGKKGNTNVLEKKDLLEDYINLFGIETIKYLTADREFIGKEWFYWLNELKLPFLIRIKSNFIANNGIIRKKVKGLFRYYQSKEKMLELFGINLKLMGKRINKKDLLIVATNNPELLLSDYSKRWLIESMFACFKKKGFNLESTKMTQDYKIDKLVALISLAYLWCILTGIIFNSKESKKRKDNHYPRKSIFKNGLELISNSISNKFFYPDKYLEITTIFKPIHIHYNHFVVV